MSSCTQVESHPVVICKISAGVGGNGFGNFPLKLQSLCSVSYLQVVWHEGDFASSL